MEKLSARSLAIAISQIGVFEHPLGSNSGPEVDKYLAAAGGVPGEPWCMSFVQWCVQRAAYPAASKLHQSPSVLEVWHHTPTTAKISISDLQNGVRDVEQGDIFIIDHGGGKGHCGFIKFGQKGPLDTVEGNTNTNGSSNGIGVFELKSRSSEDAELVGFIKVDLL